MFTRAAVIFVSLLFAALSAHGATLPGRLFYTAEQRAALDAARKAGPQLARKTVAEPSEISVAGPGLSLNGIIRSEGRTQLLINNELRDARPGEVIHDSAARVPNQRGRSVDIKVGQRLNPYTGKIETGAKNPPSSQPEPRENPPQ